MRHEWGVLAGFRLDGAPHAMKVARAVERAEAGETEKLDMPLLLNAQRFAFVSHPGCLRCGALFSRGRVDEDCPGSDTPGS